MVRKNCKAGTELVGKYCLKKCKAGSLRSKRTNRCNNMIKKPRKPRALKPCKYGYYRVDGRGRCKLRGNLWPGWKTTRGLASHNPWADGLTREQKDRRNAAARKRYWDKKMKKDPNWFENL